MSKWRYQAMRHFGDDGEPYLAVHEFYTLHDGKEAWTQRPVPLEAESAAELVETLRRVLSDVERYGVRDAGSGAPVE